MNCIFFLEKANEVFCDLAKVEVQVQISSCGLKTKHPPKNYILVSNLTSNKIKIKRIKWDHQKTLAGGIQNRRTSIWCDLILASKSAIWVAGSWPM